MPMSVADRLCCTLMNRTDKGFFGWYCPPRPLSDIFLTVLGIGGTLFGAGLLIFFLGTAEMYQGLSIFLFTLAVLVAVTGLLLALSALYRDLLLRLPW